MTINVLFFGGYMATEHDMIVWSDSAKEQRPDLWIRTTPWVIGASASDPLKKYEFIIEHNRRSTENLTDETYIVGHSSGCAIANEVASRIPDKTKIRLICLDGFVPYKDQLKNPTTQIWSARQTNILTCYSLNYKNLEEFPHFNVYEPPIHPCTHKWALHFSLVNANADDNILAISMGYYNCKANLCWLKS